MGRIHSATDFAAALLAGDAWASMLRFEGQPKGVLDLKTPGLSLEVEESSADSGAVFEIDTGTDASGTSIDIQQDPPHGNHGRCHIRAGQRTARRLIVCHGSVSRADFAA